MSGHILISDLNNTNLTKEDFDRFLNDLSTKRTSGASLSSDFFRALETISDVSTTAVNECSIPRSIQTYGAGVVATRCCCSSLLQ